MFQYAHFLLNYFLNFSDVLPIPAHDVLDTSYNQSSSFVQLHNPKIPINLTTNTIFAIYNHSYHSVKPFPVIIPIPFTQAFLNPTKNPNDHQTSFLTNPKIHLNNMGTSTTNNKHDTMNNIMHPHRSSNSGYDIMQHHHHLSTREQNDKMFPSRRKPYHNIMEIGENDDLILRLQFYFYFFFLPLPLSRFRFFNFIFCR